MHNIFHGINFTLLNNIYTYTLNGLYFMHNIDNIFSYFDICPLSDPPYLLNSPISFSLSVSVSLSLPLSLSVSICVPVCLSVYFSLSKFSMVYIG